MGRRGRLSRAEKIYSREIVIEKYDKLFNELAIEY